MKYSLGLDIGVASVGWAVVDEDKQRIHDLGVRVFEKAEQPDSGKSLALPRREARSARRRLRRRRQRLDFVKQFFVDNGLLTNQQIEAILDPANSMNDADPYELRSRGLDERLTNEELFKAVYHIAKRRGFKSNRKVLEEQDKESGAVLESINANEKLLNSYRTVGEALHKDERFSERKRNRGGSYDNCFDRSDFENEMRMLLQAQRSFGLSLSDGSIEKLLGHIEDCSDGTRQYYGVFAQRPFMTQDMIERMIGPCTFEPEEKRAPRGSYSFEKFRLLHSLVQLRIINTDTGEPRRLSTDEIAAVVNKAHHQASISYQNIRKIAEMSEDDRF
jgi:CRISPR-associated endonuclease Csn1